MASYFSQFIPFYPLRQFYRAAKEVKDNLGEEQVKYEEKLKKTRINAIEDLHSNPLTGADRRDQNLSTNTNSYKVAVIAVIIGSFEQDRWYWKVVLMFERVVLVIFIGFEMSAWATVCFTGVG